MGVGRHRRAVTVEHTVRTNRLLGQGSAPFRMGQRGGFEMVCDGRRGRARITDIQAPDADPPPHVPPLLLFDEWGRFASQGSSPEFRRAAKSRTAA